MEPSYVRPGHVSLDMGRLLLRRLAFAATLAALVAAGCRSGGAEGHAASPSPTGTTAPTVAALPQPSDRCGFPDREATVLRFPATDGTELDGAIVGTGPSGVVLANQSNSSLCGWWPFSDVLVRRGFRVLMFDFRCTGLSACPQGSGGGDYVADMAGAAAALRSNGAANVALMGASLGANVAVAAAPSIRPRVSAVLSLSGPADISEPLNNPDLNAFHAVPKMTSPFFQMVARDDPVAFIPELRKLATNAGSKVTKLVVLDASYGHGWDMISTIGGDPTDAAPEVLDFLRTYD